MNSYLINKKQKKKKKSATLNRLKKIFLSYSEKKFGVK